MVNKGHKFKAGKHNPMYGKCREQNPNWKGGRLVHKSGYIQIYSPTHPHCTNHGYVMEHRLIMEKHLGRVLLPTEICHHINGDKADNRIENLALFSNVSEHQKKHNLKQRFIKGQTPWNKGKKGSHG